MTCVVIVSNLNSTSMINQVPLPVPNIKVESTSCSSVFSISHQVTNLFSNLHDLCMKIVQLKHFLQLPLGLLDAATSDEGALTLLQVNYLMIKLTPFGYYFLTILVQGSRNTPYVTLTQYEEYATHFPFARKRNTPDL